jgi:antitoxin MazE
MPKARVQKWGNGLAVRIPKALANRMGLKDGDPIFIEGFGKRVELRPAKGIPTLEELVAKITPENRHEEIKWGRAVGNEIVGW